MGSQLNDFDAQKVVSAPHEHNSRENNISPPGENTPPETRISIKNNEQKTTQKREQTLKNQQNMDPRRGSNPSSEKAKFLLALTYHGPKQ